MLAQKPATRKRITQQAMEARQRYLATMERIKAAGGMPMRPCDIQPVDTIVVANEESK